MKHTKLPWRLLTAGFLIVIFLFGTLTLAFSGGTILSTAGSSFRMARSDGHTVFQSLSDSINAVETEYNMVFFSKASFLAGNLVMKKVLGNRFFPDSSDDMTMIRLRDSSISKLKFTMNTAALKGQLAKFKSYLDEKGIPLIFVYVHTKVLEPEKQLPVGTFDFSNRHADSFLSLLRSLNIDYIDTRDTLLSTGVPTEKLYFRTDTHWTIPSAFAVYQALARKLNESYGFAIADPYISSESYETIVHENAFLGSYGRQTTPYYTGLDDFEMVVPTFPTSLTERTQRNDNNWQVREGDFENAVLHMEQLNNDPGLAYSSHAYQTYNFNWGEVLYENHDPNADDHSVVVIKNSSGNPVTDFLALGLQNVCGLDRRNLTRATIADYIADYNPDAVVIVYNYDFLRPERLDFFTAPAVAENEVE